MFLNYHLLINYQKIIIIIIILNHIIRIIHLNNQIVYKNFPNYFIIIKINC